MERAVVDPNGYAAGERNRRLTPEEVFTAREQYFAKKVTARQLAFKFGLSTDSIRRMLRSETYANVGEALPRAEELDRMRALPDADEMVKRLMEEQERVDREGVVKEAAKKEERTALDQFLASGTAAPALPVEPDPMDGEDTRGVFGPG